ncbi:hypothetical protein JKP88DRAFT_271540 [Tribonema minus]|uniref:Uncharacterized protein n=1 Tax=Tribonema minus TaxID=303371 RepID=A0A835ZD35_9STRA|nr:hypothetical protein JKP88DRAFT_271540 [Tribonema minus]
MLTKMGADVVIACRNAEKAQRAVEKIAAAASQGGHRSDVPVGTSRAAALDLGSIASIKAFAATQTGPLDVLINNAGVMAVPTRELTEDGFERQIGVNHLGHFLLTGLLFDKLKRSPDGRVVSVSSEAHKIPPGQLNPDGDLNFEKTPYSAWPAYSQSKLANILFIRELDRRVREAAGGGRPAVTAMVVHPGACRTDLGRYLFDANSINPAAALVASPILALLVATTKSANQLRRAPLQGAQTAVHCATSPALGSGAGGGTYFLDTHAARPAAPALDAAAARALWSESERLVGLQFRV